ncbi:MAG: MMPL family transporter [Planctomycetaceae bacterium]|nr:MMPL family transporter [Planctomycetaceae bacterium]
MSHSVLSAARLQRLADQTLSLILRGRWLIIGAVVLLTIPAARIVLSTELSLNLAESFVNHPEDYQQAVGLEDRFELNPDSMIYVGAEEGAAFHRPEKRRDLRQAAKDISTLTGIQSVLTIEDRPNIDTETSGLMATARRRFLSEKLKRGEVPKSLTESDSTEVGASGTEIRETDAEVRETDASEPTAFSLAMTSASGTGHLMLIELDRSANLSPGQLTTLLDQLTVALQQRNIGERGLHICGLPAMQVAAVGQIRQTLYTLLPLGASAVAVMMLVLFRRLEPLVITGVIAVVSVLWGIGFGEWLYGKFSVLTMAVPLMVVVISTGDVIHLVSAYALSTAAGNAHDVALKKTFREMSGACSLTSITTFVGFASLGFIPSQTIRQFGISAAVGVASALILTVVLVPIFLDFLARHGYSMQVGRNDARATRMLAVRAARVGIRHPIIVTISFVVLLTIAIVGAARVHLDPDMYRRFPDTHPLSTSADYFIREFGGINSMELVLTADPDVLLAPETFRSIVELSAWCREHLPVTRVDSIADATAQLLKRIDRRNKDGIPESFVHADAVVRLFEALDRRAAVSLITSDHRSLRMVYQVPATSSLELSRISGDIRHQAQRMLPAEITVQSKGSAPLIGDAVHEIIRGHLYGFVVSFLLIMSLISFGLNSVRLGLIAVPPNLVPLFSLGGILGWTTPTCDSDILAVATLGLGLAVDDTIHFLSHYRRELRICSDRKSAIESTMQHTGIAILRTTTILAAGFLPFAMSDYFSIRMLGTYLVVILIIALIADLLLLPALLTLIGPRPVPEAEHTVVTPGTEH